MASFYNLFAKKSSFPDLTTILWYGDTHHRTMENHLLIDSLIYCQHHKSYFSAAELCQVKVRDSRHYQCAVTKSEAWTSVIQSGPPQDTPIHNRHQPEEKMRNLSVGFLKIEIESCFNIYFLDFVFILFPFWQHWDFLVLFHDRSVQCHVNIKGNWWV